MKKQRLVSGITATGQLTIGNYIGAIKNFIKLQDEYEMYIFVADLHALTVDIDQETLRNNKRNMFALYLAAGIEPNKTTLFFQSDVLEHGTMGWIMENRTTMGELSRMTQFKDKSTRNKETNGTDKIITGLLTYPALMAGDILLYNPTVVPVGADQKQHIELTQRIATRFNNEHGEVFNIPQPYINKVGGKIMSLTDPTKKMSKSSKSAKSFIKLLDDPKQARKKIMKAVTDSEGKVYLSDEKPGIKNLLTIYSSLKDIDINEVANTFKDSNYGEFKFEVANVVEEFLISIQEKFEFYLERVDEFSKIGADKASAVANKTLNTVKKHIGLI